MKTVYLSRSFAPVVVDAAKPGDIHVSPEFGDCRRLTAPRLCLVAERTGRQSELIVGLLRAIGEVAVNEIYDSRSLESWYGLVGLPVPDSLVEFVCPKCRKRVWLLPGVFGNLCGDCYFTPSWRPSI